MASIPHNTPRTRPLGVGALRTFVAVAQHLNFRVAAEALHLTQSAVSRQVQALEAELGSPLFVRHTRSVELTAAGAALLRGATAGLERIDSAVRQIRQQQRRQGVTITTWASFASTWLIPRLEGFHRHHPGIDIRIDTTDQVVDLADADVDLALRYNTRPKAEPDARYLFGEQLTQVASPWLLRERPLAQPADLAQHTWIEAGEVVPSQQHWLSWPRWLDQHAPPGLSAVRWLYFNYASQIVQAALSGQGVALARLPMVADNLANGDLVEPLPHTRLGSPYAYWLVTAPASAHRPEVQAFAAWLEAEAARTREAMGEVV
ncbi:MAG: hypothetical protein RJA09_2513 [Pseudomonadota bacterium]